MKPATGFTSTEHTFKYYLAFPTAQYSYSSLTQTSFPQIQSTSSKSAVEKSFPEHFPGRWWMTSHGTSSSGWTVAQNTRWTCPWKPG